MLIITCVVLFALSMFVLYKSVLDIAQGNRSNSARLNAIGVTASVAMSSMTSAMIYVEVLGLR